MSLVSNVNGKKRKDRIKIAILKPIKSPIPACLRMDFIFPFFFFLVGRTSTHACIFFPIEIGSKENLFFRLVLKSLKERSVGRKRGRIDEIK
ncbi:hypothetical protein LEP1GSC083_1464 [Leptospira interrogans serovar Pyrogenes str. L0374]|uniref:Uncharacterized protein n=1 Tax=Leptospira interrogans serovar Pyrogenes str. L0374 TaxID=1049928 RepID=M6K9C9_LEPIR|nr:hypothetical protein LEP1GSC083_1464 [Leptospira interrogans serovar Pyrogenes str. L0374]